MMQKFEALAFTFAFAAIGVLTLVAQVSIV